MPKHVLLQHATNEHVALVSMTRHFHENYTQYHGMEYRLSTKRRAPNHPIWDKIVDINEWLDGAADGDCGAFVDADAFWKDPYFKLTLALPDGADIGMVPMHMGYLNAGVIYMRASKVLRAFMRQVAVGNTPQRTRFPSGHPFNRPGWEDQAYVNWEICNFPDLVVAELDSKFNYFRFAAKPPSGDIVVQAWHAEAFSCTYKGLSKAVTGAPLFAVRP